MRCILINQFDYQTFFTYYPPNVYPKTQNKFSFLFIRQKIFLYDIDMNDDGSGWHSKSYSNTTNRLTTERPRAIFVIGFLWYRWCWLCTLFICGAGIYSPQFPLTLWSKELLKHNKQINDGETAGNIRNRVSLVPLVLTVHLVYMWSRDIFTKVSIEIMIPLCNCVRQNWRTSKLHKTISVLLIFN